MFCRISSSTHSRPEIEARRFEPVLRPVIAVRYSTCALRRFGGEACRAVQSLQDIAPRIDVPDARTRPA